MAINDYKLDRSVPIPLYFQLKSFILTEIKNGVYPVGSIIPTEIELHDIFQISRTTVRQAISELVKEGWLERKASKGTFVKEPKDYITSIRFFEPFYRQVIKEGKLHTTELLNLEVIKASEEISNKMNIEKNSKVISILRKRCADNVPIVIMQNYLPYNLCSFILDVDFQNESLYEAISSREETKPVVVKHIVSSLKTTMEDVNYLNIKFGDPILQIEFIAFNYKNLILDYGISRYRGDMSKLELEVSQHINTKN